MDLIYLMKEKGFLIKLCGKDKHFENALVIGLICYIYDI